MVISTIIVPLHNGMHLLLKDTVELSNRKKTAFAKKLQAFFTGMNRDEIQDLINRSSFREQVTLGAAETEVA